MVWLADTNVLVYRHDPRSPEKQARATDLLRQGILGGEARIPHQAIVEFVAATTRPTGPGEPPLLILAEALREAEDLMASFPILFPTEAVLRLAIRGSATYGLPWFDAHLWAYAEHFGIPVLYSEDFQHDRLYGTVRVLDPFTREA